MMIGNILFMNRNLPIHCLFACLCITAATVDYTLTNIATTYFNQQDGIFNEVPQSLELHTTSQGNYF